MIRPIVPSDLPALSALIGATGLFPPEMLGPMIEPYFQEAPHCGAWLTDDRDGPMAIAYCAPERMTDGTWNLYLIAVHPDRQSAGVGTALLRHLEWTLQQQGVRILLVETSGLSAFKRARGFYAARGYEH